MRCENAEKFASHRFFSLKKKPRKSFIDRSFAFAFASHYQSTCHCLDIPRRIRPFRRPGKAWANQCMPPTCYCLDIPRRTRPFPRPGKAWASRCILGTFRRPGKAGASGCSRGSLQTPGSLGRTTSLPRSSTTTTITEVISMFFSCEDAHFPFLS